MMLVSMLLSALFTTFASGLSSTPSNEARLLLPKSQVEDFPEEKASTGVSHDVFNASLAMTLVNTPGFRKDPYWQENWWKDASRNHQPAKHLRSRWKSERPLENLPEEFAPADETRRRVVFLFMVNDTVQHPELWNAFFEGANRSQYSAYVHCKNSCSQTMLKEMPTLKPVDIVPTHYCHNLVDGMVSLLKGAIADGGTKYDKFVFVSESTLPVKPFKEIFNVLGEKDESDICIFPSDHWAEAAFNNHRVVLVKHHQWVVLNYEHAKVMVKTWGSVDSQGQWSVPIRTQTYSEPLIYNAERFSRAPIANWCADEWAFFATIFGAIPEDGSVSVNIPGYRDHNGSNTLNLNGAGTKMMQGTCRTFAFWSEVDPDMTLLAKQIAKGHPENVLSCWPSCTYRPAEIEKLNNDGLLEMRRSPFLFARKFSKTIELPRFHDIILSLKDDYETIGSNSKEETKDRSNSSESSENSEDRSNTPESSDKEKTLKKDTPESSENEKISKKEKFEKGSLHKAGKKKDSKDSPHTVEEKIESLRKESLRKEKEKEKVDSPHSEAHTVRKAGRKVNPADWDTIGNDLDAAIDGAYR